MSTDKPSQVVVSESDLSSVIEHSPIAMCLATPTEGILKLNRAVCELTGLSADALLGRRLIHTLVHPDDVDDVTWVGSEVMAGRAVEVRHRLMRASGEVRWVRGSIAPMNSDDGSVRWAIAQYVDETDLVRSTQLLEQSRDALRSFAEVVAHDLRSPIGAVGGFVELLVESAGDRLTDLDFELLDSLRRSAESAADMVDSSLTHAARLEAASKAPFRLDDLVARVGDLLGPQLRTSGARISVVSSAMVTSDDGALFEVLLNLVQNSVKYRSERPPVIEVDADLEGGTISVTDNGRGIPQEQWARVFERSTQVRSTDDGLGLGLARCRTILALLGGGIAVRASGEWGTRFELHLGPGALMAVSSHV